MVINLTKRSVAFFLSLVLMCGVAQLGLSDNVFTFNVSASSFEDEITVFPESYKPYLRQLHEKYPDWKFEILETGLDWSEVIEAESSKNRNLVPKTASDLLKSKNNGDYDPKTGTYIEKDVGWVSANSIAVSYFMDPRNFLNETNIFQFELLSFDSTITVETVEEALKGTFMYDTKISYYDAQGNLLNIDKTYSQVIYEAGEAYNINPCYLASKIRNEVVVSGGEGSGSVSGKYSEYKGYYNFYNIGAYDGNEPIKNGLKWASDTVGTYGRPWTDPEKSIMGGAEYLAEKYISKGQDTGYLQKFNVTPASGDSVYTHQYMTNVSGADSQGYANYQSYLALGLMSVERVFSIPVFDNMPGANGQTSTFSLVHSAGQTATVNYNNVNLRSFASTLGNKIVTLPFGTKVTVLGKTRIASTQYNYYLNNPFWCNIKAVLNGREYTGYISADYLTIDTVTNVRIGTTFSLADNIMTEEQPVYYSSDSSVVTVNSDSTLTAVKCGTAEITAVTSNGGYDLIKLEVSHNLGNWTTTKSATCINNGVKERRCTNCSYVETETIPATGKHNSNTTISGKAATYTTTGLTSGKKCSVCGKTTVAQQTIAKLTLGKVKGLKAKTVKVDKSSSITLTWSKVSGAKKYEVYQYINKKWQMVGTSTKTSYTIKKLSANKSYKFRVRAVVDSVKGSYSTSLTVKTVPATPTLTLKVGSKQLTASWKTISDISGYEVQYSTSSKMKSAKTVKVKKSSKKTTIKKLTKGKKYYVRVRTYKTVNGKKVYSFWSTVKNVKVK